VGFVLMHRYLDFAGNREQTLAVESKQDYLKSILPWQVVVLVSVIYQVEQLPGMRGPAKRWEAGNRLRNPLRRRALTN
jgi:hypothetical protein